MQRETAEYSKIMDTTQYLFQIAICTEIYENTKLYKGMIDFEQAYTISNMIYNIGYAQMGMGQYMRPILTPCKDKVSGHCLRENLRLLRKYMKPTKLLNPPMDKKKYYLK